MHEVELKFQVLPGQRRAVDAALAASAGPGKPARRVRLQAAYVDTPGGALAAAGLALRVRREGTRWVQTLKGAARDGMTRLEHNVPLPGRAGTPPEADPARHAGTAVGEQLLAVLAGLPGEPLQVNYRTDILRRTCVLGTTHGSVELAFDEGRILAGERSVPVCELEIELHTGTPAAVLETARGWVPRHGLWLDTRSKAERGERLSRGDAVAPARRAQPVLLDREMDAAQALRVLLRSCTDQVLGNVGPIADGAATAEHVHQLRVGLRRLRTALRLFAGLAELPPCAEGAAALFGRLGVTRDLDVLGAEFGAELGAALAAVGVDGAMPLPEPVATADPGALLRAAETQTLWLDLLAAGLEPGTAEAAEGAAPEPPLRAQLARRLRRWHRRAAADALRFDALDDLQRHGLRKRIKRLRYAVEFSAALFGPRRVRRYLKPLRVLQERLGALNDVAVAMQVFHARRDSDGRAWFALGWLAARRERLLAEAGPDLEAFAHAPGFWRER